MRPIGFVHSTRKSQPTIIEVAPSERAGEYPSGVSEAQATIAHEIERYVRTGATDPYQAAWPGGALERAQRAQADLRGALVREVKRRAEGRLHLTLPAGDTITLTRGKVAPMVRGLFPRAEQGAVLAALERSVVFVTHDSIEQLLRAHAYDTTAWDLANLYLASLGAELLADEAWSLAGLSEETTCYVSPKYFDQHEPFADFIVHEAAHIFHNCKRRTVGLRETRRREWLLNIEYQKRETFAYACEAYARVLERAGDPAQRLVLADEFARTMRISDERVDAAEVANLVGDASSARNGWKVILRRCEP